MLLRATLDDPNVIVWREAAEMARCTYSYWRRVGGADAYTVYRAAQDRGDAAQDALAAIG